MEGTNICIYIFIPFTVSIHSGRFHIIQKYAISRTSRGRYINSIPQLSNRDLLFVQQNFALKLVTTVSALTSWNTKNKLPGFNGYNILRLSKRASIRDCLILQLINNPQIFRNAKVQCILSFKNNLVGNLLNIFFNKTGRTNGLQVSSLLISLLIPVMELRIWKQHLHVITINSKYVLEGLYEWSWGNLSKHHFKSIYNTFASTLEFIAKSDTKVKSQGKVYRTNQTSWNGPTVSWW